MAYNGSQPVEAQQTLLSAAPTQNRFVSTAPTSNNLTTQASNGPSRSGSSSNNTAAPTATAPVTSFQVRAEPEVVISAGLAAREVVEGQIRTSATQITPESLANQQAAASVTPAASPTGTPTPARSQLCDTSVSPLYCVYTVQPGDTLEDIAKKFGFQGNDDVTAAEILAASNKPDVADEDELQIGQKLRIPSTGNAVLHTVLVAQTLSDIAEQYDVSTRDILAVPLNGIANPDSIAIGQEVLVPSPKRFAVPLPPPTPTPVPPAPSRQSSGSGSSSSSSSGSSSAPSQSSQAASAPRSSSGFIWPASGPLSSYFGPSHPLGIDIDFYANPNQPVVAVAAGTVTFAGGNTCCSYGLYVVVDHGNGLQTLYAHLSRINVSVGQRVGQGEVLGLGGRTGYATGNHLHFEVHRNGAVVNPLNYLP